MSGHELALRTVELFEKELPKKPSYKTTLKATKQLTISRTTTGRHFHAIRLRVALAVVPEPPYPLFEVVHRLGVRHVQASGGTRRTVLHIV